MFGLAPVDDQHGRAGRPDRRSPPGCTSRRSARRRPRPPRCRRGPLRAALQHVRVLGREAQVVGLVVVDRLVVPAEPRARRLARGRRAGRTDSLRRADHGGVAGVPAEGEEPDHDGAHGEPAPRRPHPAPGRPGRGPLDRDASRCTCRRRSRRSGARPRRRPRGARTGLGSPSRRTRQERRTRRRRARRVHTSRPRPAIEPAAAPTRIQRAQAHVDSGNAQAVVSSPATVTRKDPTARRRPRPIATCAISSDPAAAIPASRGPLGVNSSPGISQPLPGRPAVPEGSIIGVPPPRQPACAMERANRTPDARCAVASSEESGAPGAAPEPPSGHGTPPVTAPSPPSAPAPASTSRSPRTRRAGDSGPPRAGSS